jgi:hypothetical protein
MVAFLRRQRLNLPLAPLAGIVLGALLAILFLILPEELLESLVVNSGIASVLAAAQPPLGFTARAMLAIVVGGGAGALLWFALFLLVGGRTVAVNIGSDADGVPVLRRADAHPDAPARSPLRATRDLGTPFLDVRARTAVKSAAPEPEAVTIIEATPHIAAEPVLVAPEPVTAPTPASTPTPTPTRLPEPQPIAASDPDPVPMPKPLPDDLDIVLADYDPAAWRAAAPVRQPAPEPLPPLRKPAPVPGPLPIAAPHEPAFTPEPYARARQEPDPATAPLPIRRPQTFDEGERFETFELTPIHRDRVAQAPLSGEGSVLALLDRLERGVARRERPAKREESLQDALASLRELARRHA